MESQRVINHILFLDYNKKGETREGSETEYGRREGDSKVGTYKSGIGRAFVVWHCKSAFKEGSKCVDSMCGLCMMNHGESDHICDNCGQNISDYKDKDNQVMMMRERLNWAGPDSEVCAICHIEL